MNLPMTFVTGVSRNVSPLIVAEMSKKVVLFVGKVRLDNGQIYETIVASRRPLNGELEFLPIVRTKNGWRWVGGSYTDELTAPLKQITSLDWFPILRGDDQPN